MKQLHIWYTIEKQNDIYTVWLNKEYIVRNKKGGIGSYGLYSAKKKKDCIEYCKKKGIEYDNR